MVSANPLFRGTWTARKFQATVINDIWPEVLFFSLIATSKSLRWFRSLLLNRMVYFPSGYAGGRDDEPQSGYF